MSHQILVTGASGNLGSKVAQELASRNVPFQISGRNANKLAALGSPIYRPGNLEEQGFLKQVLEGVKAVFLVLPSLNNLSLPEFAANFIQMAESAGVTHVVNISNCTLSRYSQPTSLIEFENLLNDSSKLNIKHLRCANFFENLNWGIHTPYRGDISLPYISSYEIAFVAANYLEKQNFTGISVDELMGKRDYSMNDFAEVLGVKYQQQPCPPEQEWFFGAFNQGEYQLVQRTAENTSKLTEERFSLDYFLENHFNKSFLES